MNKKDTAIDELLKARLLPLFYHDSEDVSVNMLQALYAAGIRIVEYTNRGPQALSNFRILKKYTEQHLPGLLLGVGTIRNEQQAKDFIEAGADLVVCPCIDEKIGSLTNKAGLLWIPGCMTTSEIARAENANAEIVKIFPGSILGPDYIKAIREIFPSLKFMPTGGVDATTENLTAWFNAGVVAVGMGSKLVSKEILDKQDYKLLSTNTTAIIHEIKNINS